ncbi:hypothetical protein Nepgr_021874 [Nepenthes gracilis]|uniref:Pentatricopeptide repeat-containing protein n=1 Tax=Nepenthes gracilis TaxID=150966 RepID=A0AAD3SZ86_NEPGR|nr:hypothetical protein Nepgr_021874 [Nepenthes gracilis]
MRSNLHQVTSKIVALARSGKIINARKLFDEMPNRDTVAWNAMLTCYSQLCMYEEALCLFQQLRITSIKPDQFTFTAALSVSAAARDMRYGLIIHALVVVLGCQNSLHVNNSLIDLYGKCMNHFSAKRVFEDMHVWNEVSWCSLLFAYTNSGLLDIANEVFRSMPKGVQISWNIMISGHAQAGDTQLCLSLFREMRENDCCPDQWTLSSLMSACAKVGEFYYGCMIHGFLLKSGWNSSPESHNSILSFYAELGSQDDVSKVLESIGTSNQVSWNAIIDAHIKIGNIHKASLIFQQAPENSVITWTSMISGFARNGHEREALSLFADMARHCIKPDELTFSAVLLACSGLAVLGHGMMIHGFLTQHGFQAHVYLGNGLVNMYAKCGDLEASSEAFKDILQKDLVSWNAMLFAYTLHGQAIQALQLHEEMVASGVTPDQVTFIGLLMACSHTGLIERGQLLFKCMESVHGLPHKMHHVACVVDLLCRGEYIAEARSLTEHYEGLYTGKKLSSEAVLGACSSKLDVRMGTKIGEYLMISEPGKDMSYVHLSNLYCASGQWQEAEMIRKAMADQGVRKMPGCSWIEVRNELTSFVSADHSHPRTEKI